MLTLAQIISRIEQSCPLQWQETFDNSGLQVGNPAKPCRRLLLALDMTAPVLREAIAEKVDLIITHHPLLFHGLKSLDGSTYQGKLIYGLIEHDIALLSLHTNLDKAGFGVSRALFDALGLVKGEIWLTEGENFGLGFRGEVPAPLPFAVFLQEVKARLQAPSLKYRGDAARLVRSVAVLGGSGASYLEQAADDGFDVYISGDFKYSDGQRGLERDLCVIDGGHYATEVVVMTALRDQLAKILAGETEQQISENNCDYWQYL